MMEMMSGMKTEIKSEINVVNMSLNEIKTENNNLKSENKSEINAVNIKLTDLNNEFMNVRSELRAVSYTHLDVYKRQVTTNDIVDENVEIDVNETVVAGGSKDNGVNIFNQLALKMCIRDSIKFSY